MSGNSYGVGLVGAGWVAAEYLKAFRNHPLTEVVGIYNRTPGKATALMQAHGIQGQEYASLDELMDDARIQIVVSCTHPMHVQNTVSAPQKPDVTLCWKNLSALSGRKLHGFGKPSPRARSRL